jgi:hypothetical protein
MQAGTYLVKMKNLKNIKKVDYNKVNPGPEEDHMSKPRDTHKEKKKKPQKTAKEKKLAKLEKKKNKYQQFSV